MNSPYTLLVALTYLLLTAACERTDKYIPSAATAATPPLVLVISPTFTDTTVDFNYFEPPYPASAHLLDTTRADYGANMSATVLSFLGDVRRSAAMMDESANTMGMDTARYERLQRLRPTNAAARILRDAETHEIVIINEAHHEPRHRVFPRDLLQGLWDRGYRHLGLETLSPFQHPDSLVTVPPYFPLVGGFYTREPQFADLANEARHIGYTLFPYEASSGGNGPATREAGQASNIHTYRQRYPSGKLLLHVGYTHAKEGYLGGRWGKAMAQRLADTTGLNPLTVNQTHFRERSRRELERYEYQTAELSAPTIFVDDNDRSFQLTDTVAVSWFDHYVFHPRTKYYHDRPDYLFRNGRRPVRVATAAHPAAEPLVWQAYPLAANMAEAVPFDVMESDAAQESVLALAPGDYRLLATTKTGRQYVATINVPND